MDPLERFLQLVRSRLGAEDAWLEIGGIEPSYPDEFVAAEVGDGVKVVARFSTSALAHPDTRGRLSDLISAFRGVADMAKTRAIPLFTEPERSDGAALGDALAILADRAGATRAFVIDSDSPVIWACHPPDSPGLASAGHDTPMFELLRRVRQGSDAEGDGGDAAQEHHVARFGGIYRVVLVFDEGGSSPLRVEGSFRRALPVIEKLVLALPPIEPDPTKRPTRGAAVVQLRRP